MQERENKEKWFSTSKLKDGNIESPFFETENCSNGDKEKGNVFVWNDIEKKTIFISFCKEISFLNYQSVLICLKILSSVNIDY